MGGRKLRTRHLAAERGVSSRESMHQPQLLAYLDHNILDLMSKGDPDDVAGFLIRASLTPVFSDENLAEIRRSKVLNKSS